MDAFAMIVLTVPPLFPVVLALGFDPIWYGIIIILFVEMGVITPPVGLNVYVVKGMLPHIPIETIFRGAAPYVVCEFIGCFILMIFPKIVTYLPGLIK